MKRALIPSSPGFLVTLAVLLAVLHAVLAVTATTEKSMTADEIGHLTAGHAYNTRNDYRLQPENGNLPQRWAALPLCVLGAQLPPSSDAFWNRADVWAYGYEFFYRSPVPVEQGLFLGRAMIALFSLGTGLLVFFWSRALFGWKGAFLSLLLFIFCPAFLAHGALATSDVVMTFFFLASVGAWWRHLEHPGFWGGAISAGVLGLAFVAKYSAILLPPMLGLIALAWLWNPQRDSAVRLKLWRLFRTTCGHLLVVWACLWLFYGCRYSAFSAEGATAQFHRADWSQILAGLDVLGPWIVFFRDHHLLPQAWLYGLTHVIQFSAERGAFLNGEYSLTGWVQFFPYTFLVKSTLPFLLLIVGTVVTVGRAATQRLLRDGRYGLLQSLRPLTPLVVLFALYWFASLTTHLNIGHRHILPTYPVLFIAAGCLGAWLDRRHWLAGGLILGLLGWHVAESSRIRPHYLAYFNPLAGGPANGWRHLVDSSLDWGQDLPGLAHWLEQNNAGPNRAPVFLSYFGAGDPSHEGIVAEALPRLPRLGPDRPWRALSGGLYCISATMLQQVYGPVRGEWTLENEQEYQQFHRTEGELLAFQNDPARRTELLRETKEAQWAAAWKRYELLRFARLCYYLRARQPDAMIGYSIFVYRLTPAEVDAALNRRYSDWLEAVERAGQR